MERYYTQFVADGVVIDDCEGEVFVNASDAVHQMRVAAADMLADELARGSEVVELTLRLLNGAGDQIAAVNATALLAEEQNDTLR